MTENHGEPTETKLKQNIEIPTGESRVKYISYLIQLAKKNKNELQYLVNQDKLDINYQSKLGWTALHLAAASREHTAVRHLLDLGAEWNIKNKQGVTAYYIAKENNFYEIIEIFREKFELVFQCKLNYLRELLENLEVKGVLTYKQAYIFILFLETFSLSYIPDATEVYYITRKFSFAVSQKIIVNIYNFIINMNEVIKLHHINAMIELCYPKDLATNRTKVDLFFTDLRQCIMYRMTNFSPSQKQNCKHNDKMRVHTFLEDNSDKVEDHLRDNNVELLFNDFRISEDLEEAWFEFVFDVIFCSNVEEKHVHSMNEVEKQVWKLRTNLLHNFYK